MDIKENRMDLQAMEYVQYQHRQIQQVIINNTVVFVQKQLENLVIEGLKRKGFLFKNKMELEKFIVSNCRCEDNVNLKKRTYFVNDFPFFLHFYGVQIDSNPVYANGITTISANYGNYAFL